MYVITKGGKTPIITQLYNQIKNQIVSGELSTEIKLPSVRTLSRDLNIARNTVDYVYQQLQAEGYIESRMRSGYYVKELDFSLPMEKNNKPDLLTNNYEPDKRNILIDFNPGILSPGIFPMKVWRRLSDNCAKESLPDLSFYNEPQGELGLRIEIKKYLAASRGVTCSPEQIIISAGTAQSLSIICQILKGNVQPYGIEEPGYATALSVFTNHSCSVLPVAVNSDGLDLQELLRSNCRAVYVTPSHQFPLGFVMPIANRLKLLQWADEMNSIIIEDDYDSELCYYGQPIPSLQSLNSSGNIVYLGTFSKALSPALRVSYMVLPSKLLSLYKNLFRDYQSPVCLLTQKTLEQFMKLGHWERHLRRIRSNYRKKHDILLGAIERHLGNNVSIISKGAGLHIPLRVLGNLSDKELISRAEERGVKVYPISSSCISPKLIYSANNNSYTGVRLGFGSISESQIEEGIKLLKSAWF